MVNPNTAAQASVGVIVLSGVLGAVKLVAVGICLAIGFAIGNIAIQKLNNHMTGWYYARQEKKHDEPEEKDSDNGGLSDDAES